MMVMKGSEIKQEILNELKDKVSSLGITPGLAVIQVGDDPASNVYIKQKENMARDLGYYFEHIKLEENIKESDVLDIIYRLNKEEKIDGILVQMPLPNHLDQERIQNAISSVKDVDGLTDINTGRLSHNKKCLAPCTPLGVIELLKRYEIDIVSKNVVVIGRSTLVGRPLAAMLTNLDATVTLCHSKTKNLSSITKGADIIVAAIGKKGFVTEDMVSDGAVVIDVGINRFEGKLYGDVDFLNVSEKCSFITPVPLGVGPMTVAMLAKNVYTAHLQRKNDLAI